MAEGAVVHLRYDDSRAGLVLPTLAELCDDNYNAPTQPVQTQLDESLTTMQTDMIDHRWIQAFVHVFELCKMHQRESIVILSESQSRPLNIQLSELALGQLGLSYFHIKVPTPAEPAGPIIRSTGACMALEGQPQAVATLGTCDVIIDLTVEGLMHATQTAGLLKAGARIMNISNEHPDTLARLIPTAELKAKAKDSVKRCRSAKRMLVRTAAGTNLNVNMQDAATVGVWGWTDKAGTLAHWPGGIVVSFPKAGAVNGQLMYQPGDINLTFKRYFDSAVELTIENDFVTDIQGTGTDAALMRDYFAAFNEPHAYATSHVGWGFNPAARYEALTMYDKCDTNGTELRALAGNFLYSTGANEFAQRFTRGHFDLPMMGCDIELDGELVVENGKPV